MAKQEKEILEEEQSKEQAEDEAAKEEACPQAEEESAADGEKEDGGQEAADGQTEAGEEEAAEGDKGLFGKGRKKDKKEEAFKQKIEELEDRVNARWRNLKISASVPKKKKQPCMRLAQRVLSKKFFR